MCSKFEFVFQKVKITKKKNGISHPLKGFFMTKPTIILIC